MTTELRNFGDGRTIVVYTDEGKVAQRIRDWSECFKVVPYEQEQYSKRKIALVGLDLYLPRTHKVVNRLKRMGFNYGRFRQIKV